MRQRLRQPMRLRYENIHRRLRVAGAPRDRVEKYAAWALGHFYARRWVSILVGFPRVSERTFYERAPDLRGFELFVWEQEERHRRRLREVAKGRKAGTPAEAFEAFGQAAMDLGRALGGMR